MEDVLSLISELSARVDKLEKKVDRISLDGKEIVMEFSAKDLGKAVWRANHDRPAEGEPCS